MNISFFFFFFFFCNLLNTGESMSGNLQNFAYEFVPDSPAVLFVLRK